MAVALLVAGVVATSLVVLLPMFLPWPQRLRWLVAHAALSGELTAEEVLVVDVRTRPNGTLLVLDRGHERARLALDAPPHPTSADLVLWWAIEQTPLLLCWESYGLSLHSGTDAVHGLRVRPDERAPTVADA